MAALRTLVAMLMLCCSAMAFQAAPLRSSAPRRVVHLDEAGLRHHWQERQQRQPRHLLQQEERAPAARQLAKEELLLAGAQPQRQAEGRHLHDAHDHQAWPGRDREEVRRRPVQVLSTLLSVSKSIVVCARKSMSLGCACGTAALYIKCSELFNKSKK